MKKILTFIAATLMVFSTAFAQENNNRDANGKVVRGPYETNAFWSNWFVDFGAGVNTFVAEGQDFGGHSLATSVNVGKWITPSVGARVGWTGLRNATTFDESTVKFGYNTANADVLWHVSNAIGGYKETRTWNVIIYPEVALINAKYRTGLVEDYATDGWAREFGAGLGMINQFRICDRVNINVDIKGIVTKDGALIDNIATQLPTYDEMANKYAVVPTATVGLSINLGKTGFKRHSTVVAPLYASLAAAEAALAAANAQCAALTKENDELRSRKPVVDTVTVTNTILKPVGNFIVTFPIGQCKVSTLQEALIGQFVEGLDEDVKIVVTGSADSKTGSTRRNEQLANDRAANVANVIVNKYGVDSQRVTVDTKLDSFTNAELSRCAIVAIAE